MEVATRGEQEKGGHTRKKINKEKNRDREIEKWHQVKLIKS